MRTWRVWLLSAVACAAYASHHLSHQELLKANLEAMREAVTAQVADPQRAVRVNKAIDDLREQLLSFDAAHRTYQSNVVALSARPDATRAEFETLAENFGKERIAFRNRVFELHAEMIKATTAEEWKGLYRYERNILAVSPEL
jgi:Spy/CpxP family protein refolding chaperone